MFVTLPSELLASWIDSQRGVDAGAGTRLVWGRWIDGEDVLRLSLPGEIGTQPVGIWVTEQGWQADPDAVRREVGTGRVVVVANAAFDAAYALDTRAAPWARVSVDLIRLVA